MAEIACKDLRESEFHGKQAIAAALLAAGRGVTGTAAELAINPATIHRWLTDPTFKRLVAAHRAVFYDEALGRLSSIAVKAVETLEKVLDSPAEPLRLKAAVAILDRMVGLREHVEIEERLAALEERLTAGTSKGGNRNGIA